MNSNNFLSSYQPLDDERTFTLFPNLPSELRDMIWTRALPNEARRIKLHNIELADNNDRCMTCSTNPIPTPLLHACTESRIIALTRYSIAFDDNASPSHGFLSGELPSKSMYLDWERDIIEFCGRWSMFGYCPSEEVLNDSYLARLRKSERDMAKNPLRNVSNPSHDYHRLYQQHPFELRIRHLACARFGYIGKLGRALRTMPNLETFTFHGIARSEERILKKNIKARFGQKNEGTFSESRFVYDEE